jgi:hypothetical protein
MKTRLLFLITLLYAAVASQAATFITFDAPGSTSTFSSAINPGGVITGGFIDTTGALHGFGRIP